NKKELGTIFESIPVEKIMFNAPAPKEIGKVEPDAKSKKNVQGPVTDSKKNDKSEADPKSEKSDKVESDSNSKKSDAKKKVKGDGKVTEEKKKAPEKESVEKDIEVSVSLLNIQVGLIRKAWKHPSADSLLVEEIDLGDGGVRQVVSGLAKYCSPEELTNRRVALITNVKPGKLRDVSSSGLVLCASNAEQTAVEPLLPPEGAAIGERVSFSGHDGKPEDVLNPKKKQLEKITLYLRTDDKGIATFKGIPFMTTAGPCTSSIPNASNSGRIDGSKRISRDEVAGVVAYASTFLAHLILCLVPWGTCLGTKTRAFVQQGHYIEALRLYNQTIQHSQLPDKFTYPSLLKACAALSSQNHGKILHATIITMGLQFDPFIATSLVNMYVKCGFLCHAVQVFVKVSESEKVQQDVTLWNSIIDGCFRCGRVREGVDWFRRMKFMGVRPDVYSLCSILGVCSDLSGVVGGKQVHGYVVRNIFECDAFLDSALIDMYMKCGQPIDAWRVYDKLEDKSNVVVRNVMIGGFCKNGMWEKSFEFYAQTKKEGCKFGSAMLSNILMVCSQTGNLNFGMEVHCDVMKCGLEWEPYVCTSLLTMYGRFKLVEEATRVFGGIRDKGIELWNALISAFIGSGCVHEAFKHYDEMRSTGCQSDSFTVTTILSACGIGLFIDFGRRIHGEVIKRPTQNNTAVQSALLTMYAKCGYIEDAILVFSAINERDAVAWGSMISGFFQNKKYEEGLRLLKAMEADGVRSDSTVMASLIGATAALECGELGRVIHGFVIKNGTSLDVFVGSALIDMYAKCVLPDEAETVFWEMPRKNIVAWNSIICCYSRNGLPELSIGIFPQILNHGLTPDLVSITNVLVAISSLTTLLKGKAVHGYHIRIFSQPGLQVENALIDMYAKCGCLKYAHAIFQNMACKNVVTWNSIIGGYGSHGECLKALELFNQMQAQGELPDEITFLALISACSHSGSIAEGLRLFESMREYYEIEPKMEHYAILVDLWGRAGYLNEAYNFIKGMPINPDESVWLCLLFACRTHRNIVLGELVADQLMQMEPSRGNNYVELLSLYGEGQLWDKAANIRLSMKDKRLKKIPGCSWIEMKDEVKVFLSGDSSSPKTLEIYGTLRNLTRNMKKIKVCKRRVYILAATYLCGEWSKSQWERKAHSQDISRCTLAGLLDWKKGMITFGLSTTVLSGQTYCHYILQVYQFCNCCLRPQLVKSIVYNTQTIVIDESTIGTGPNNHSNKGTVIYNILLPIKVNRKPLSIMPCTYPRGRLETAASILASPRHPIATELHRKPLNRNSDDDPYFRTMILLDCKPK
ncbi:Pentatricopeptide repeat-containing protein, partial [Thalictrum thalictroides]